MKEMFIMFDKEGKQKMVLKEMVRLFKNNGIEVDESKSWGYQVNSQNMISFSNAQQEEIIIDFNTLDMIDIDKSNCVFENYVGNDDVYHSKATVPQVINDNPDVSCVLVDEAQFLQPKQVDQLMAVVLEMDIPVICYGLRTDFLTKGFPGASRLLELAHSIEEMKTICKCGRKAIFNARFVDGEFTLDGDQVAIDGEQSVTYQSMCGKCYTLNKNRLKK